MVVNQNQSLVDFSIQHCGDATAVFDLAIENNLSITDELESGAELTITSAVEQQIVDFFANKNIIPATEEKEEDKPLTGIGYWRIGVDFKVS